MSEVPSTQAPEQQAAPRPQSSAPAARPQQRPRFQHNDRQGGRPQRSDRSGGKRRSFPTSNEPKTAAAAVEKPEFFKRTHAISRDDGFPNRPNYDSSTPRVAFSKNVGWGGISPVHNIPGVVMKTNSPVAFPSGPSLKVIPLGGSNEVGMNMTAFEYGDDIILIDTGFGFGGGEKFPGVDYIIPDTAYVEQNRHKIRGLFYTHAHLDHIGAAPYILPKLGDIPIFGMPLTLALLKNRLQEFQLDRRFTGKVIDVTKPIRLGSFVIDFFRLNHSIPDVIGLSLSTPVGRVLYCTDWKFDSTPPDGMLSDYAKIAQFGQEGVRLLMTDSLGILKPGFQISELKIGETVKQLFGQTQGRIIFTTFASSISRLQHVIDACVKFNRKLAITGRSMVNNFTVCVDLGYLKVPRGLIVELRDIAKLPAEKVCILATGSQGEDRAGLSRIARGEHDLIKLQGGDSVIFSSGVIPGNEDMVQDLTARLSRKGVDVYNYKEFDLHVSGHACQEDLKLLFALAKPDYLQPIHGDHFMIKKTAELGAKMGIPFDHCLVGENGRITELQPHRVVLTEDVITEKYLLVDGSGVGSVSEAVLEERRHMATQGTVILVALVNKKKQLIAGPEIISRGFVYMKNNTDLFEEIKQELKKTFQNLNIDPESKSFFTELRNEMKKEASKFIYQKLEKDPMIIPVVVQV